MTDCIYIGASPHEESCVQVKTGEDYLPAQRAECIRYRDDLEKFYGPAPEGAALKVKRESHDFGSYYEVVCVFDANNEEAVAYAYKVEDGLAKWL